MFLKNYAKPRLASWKRYQLSFESLNEAMGKIPLGNFRRHHLHGYVQRRVTEVEPGTVNRDIAAIKKMFSFALEVGAINSHPLVRFPTLKTQETGRRVLTVEEFRSLVEAMDRTEIAAWSQSWEKPGSA